MHSLSSSLTVAFLCLCVINSPVDARYRRSKTNTVAVTALDGRTVTLRCALLKASPPDIRWSDTVYNEGSDPQLIFTSVDNDEMAIDEKHPKSDHFKVDSNYSLTISGLDIAHSAGLYSCQSAVGSTVHRLNYDVTVVQMPQCSGVVHLHAGTSESVSLACESLYSGNERPIVQWFRKPHERHGIFDSDGALDAEREDTDYGDPIVSVDESDVSDNGPFARQVVHKDRARYYDDGATYTCRMTLQGMDETCKLTLNVTYLVRNVTIRPHKQKMNVGDTVECHARGNPIPEITLEPSTVAQTTGSGWKSFVIDHSMQGQKVKVTCTAVNTVGELTERLTKEHVIHVAEHRPNDHEPTPHNAHPPRDVQPDVVHTGEVHAPTDEAPGQYKMCLGLTLLSTVFALVIPH